MASVVLACMWIAFTSIIILFGLLQISAPALPQVLQDVLLYGKARGKRKQWTFVRLIEVPKKWFIHFYIVGVLVNATALVMVVSSYMFGNRPSQIFQDVLDWIISSKETSTGAASAILGIGMMLVQNIRRLLECLFVSVYSQGTINLAHYAMGILLYSTFCLVVLSEAPELNTYRVMDPVAEFLQPHHIAGLILFLWASYHHHVIHHTFADLRLSKKGNVQNLQHHIPRGGWFEYVSSPHYFMEILIYLAFIVVVGQHHRTLWTVVLFVIGNQLIAGYITHLWYLKTFKEYPKKRTAVIPFLI